MIRRLRQESQNLRSRVDKCTIRVSKCAETYVEFFNLHSDYDAFLVQPEPQNPWVSDSTELWEIYDKCTAKDQVSGYSSVLPDGSKRNQNNFH